MVRYCNSDSGKLPHYIAFLFHDLLVRYSGFETIYIVLREEVPKCFYNYGELKRCCSEFLAWHVNFGLHPFQYFSHQSSYLLSTV